MRSRFHRFKLNTFLLSAAFLLVWVILFAIAADHISHRSLEDDKKGLATALEKDITTCYALEGSYPPDLDYLKDHYGLTYDETRFYVDYRPIASNLRPEVVVIAREETP